MLPIARLSHQHATTGASDVNVGGRARPRASLQMESSEGNDGATTIASRGEEVVGEVLAMRAVLFTMQWGP